MKVKLNFALAFATDTSTLLLDEATAGLDPMIRDDVLDLLLDYVQDEQHAVLFSSHIVSDLEKIADYIVFLHQGKVLLKDSKDRLLDTYGIAHLSSAEAEKANLEHVVTTLKRAEDVRVLINNRADFSREYPQVDVVAPSLEDIIVMIGKGTNI